MLSLVAQLHYSSKVWGHLEMSLFLEVKLILLQELLKNT